MYSIKRDGPRWLVMQGWSICASFDSKGEALAWVEWAKEQDKKDKAR